MKRLIALMLALVMVFALAACGGGGTTTTPSAPPAGTDPTPPPAGDPDPTDAPVDDTVYTLIFSNHDPASNPTALFVDEWVKEVEEASGGRLKFDVYNGGAIASVTESLDMVANGSIDLCWNAPAVFPGRFNTSLVSQLPLINYPTGETGGKILWDMYSSHEYFSDEWSDFHVIALHPNSQAVIMTTNKQITDIADFNGLRLRTTTPVIVSWLEEVGGVPMSFQITESFENLEKNVADGTIGDWTNAATQRLYEVLDYAMDYNAFVAIGCIVMNKDSYANLPDDLKEILDQYSGEYASMMGGRVLDSFTQIAIDESVANGVELVTPSDELITAMKDAAQVAIDNWIASMNDLGHDGQQIVDDLMATIEKHT